VPRARSTGPEYRSRADHILALNAGLFQKLQTAIRAEASEPPSVVTYVEVAPALRQHVVRDIGHRDQHGLWPKSDADHGTGTSLQHELDAGCRLGCLAPSVDLENEARTLAPRRGWRLSSGKTLSPGRYQLDWCGPGAQHPDDALSIALSQPAERPSLCQSLSLPRPERIMRIRQFVKSADIVWSTVPVS